MLRTLPLSLRTLTFTRELSDHSRLIGANDPPSIAYACVPRSPSRPQASAAAALRRLAPLGDRVLVKRVVQEAKTAGGIFLPDTGKKLNEGEVRWPLAAAGIVS